MDNAVSSECIRQLDRLIDETVRRACRRIEDERQSRAYGGSNPEAGITTTERALVDAMVGRMPLLELAELVGEN